MNLLESLPTLIPAAERSEVSVALRRGALLLHSLEKVDRDWMIQQLPDEQQVQVQGLLIEISELGLPADRQLLRDALDASGNAGTGQTAIEGDSPPAIQRLARLSAEALYEVLRAEPDRLIAHVIRLADWPWTERLLAQLGSSRKRRVLDVGMAAEEQCGTKRAADALSARDLALLDALELRARRQFGEQARQQGDDPVRRPLLEDIKAWVQRLRPDLVSGKRRR